MCPVAVVTGSVITNTLKCFLGAVGGEIRYRCGKQPYDNTCAYMLSCLAMDFYDMLCKPHLNDILSLSS